MNKEIEAKKIGFKYAVVSNLVGLSIACLVLLIFMEGEPILKRLFLLGDFITDMMPNLGIGLIAMFLSAYFFGKKAGIELLIKDKVDSHWVGLKTGLLILFVSTLAGSLVGFFQEGFGNIGTGDNPFNDYIFKPFFWVFLFGFFPVLLVGIWYGNKVQSKVKSLKESAH